MSTENSSLQSKEASTTKLKFVFLPFLAWALGALVIYTSLRWLLDLRLGIIPLDEAFLAYWIPLGLSVLLCFLFLRRRFSLLKLQGARFDGYFYYPIMAGGLMAIPIMVTQAYVQQASFSLIDVSKPSLLDPTHPNKYYHFADFEVDSVNAGGVSVETSRTEGKDDIVLHLYLTVPMVDTIKLPYTQALNVWYGKRYDLRINDNVEDAERETMLEAFITKSFDEFYLLDFHSATFFENLPNGEDRTNFASAIAKTTGTNNLADLLILTPHSEPFSERMGNLLAWCFGSMGICLFLYFLMTWIPKLDVDELTRFKEKKPMADDEFKSFLSVFVPSGDQFITAILLDLNILVFLVMVVSGVNLFSPDAEQLLAWGACERTAVVEGDYWRLLVSTFEHGGILHLVMNAVGLFIAGLMTEPILGRWRFAVLYLLAGIAASVASIVWHTETVSVGASGAIFGLFGAMLALLVTRIIPKETKGTYWYILIAYGLVSLLFGFFKSGTDNAAHVGGLAAGFVIGLVFALLSWKKLKAAAE